MNEDFIKLIIARLNTMPDNVKVNLGGAGTLQKSDLINAVTSQSVLGKQIVAMQIAYLRTLKDLFSDMTSQKILGDPDARM